MLAYFLFLISKEDIKTRQIPDEYSLAIAILSIGLTGFSLNRLNLALLVLILSSFCLGLGDAKLLGALSLLFGCHIFYIIFFSFILSAVYSLYMLVVHEIGLKDTVPFAPFIAVSSLSVAVTLLKQLLCYNM